MNSEFKRMQRLAGVKEMQVQDPTKVNLNRLEIGDKLLIKHTDPFVAFVFRVGQVWEIANIDEDYEHYRLVNTNTQTSLGFSKRDLSEMIENGVFGYYRKPKTNEAVIRDPRIKEIVDNIIILDKKFIDIILKMSYDNTNQMRLMSEFYDKYEKYGIVDALELGYDTLREELVKQPYKSLVQLYEELKLVMNKLPNTIGEMKIMNPVFKTPEGWSELEPNWFPGFLMFIRPEVKNGGEVIEGWITDNTMYNDVVILVKNGNQYYVEGVDNDEYIIQEGPFPTELIAKRKVLEVINNIIENRRNLNEMRVANPIFTAPEEWTEDNDIEQDPELWGGEVVRSWWAPMNGDDEEHADRIFLVKNNNQYYIRYVYAFANDDVEGPFLKESEALSKVLEAMKDTMSYWNEPFDDGINEIRVKDPTIPDIIEFGDKNIEEIKKLVGYEGDTILKTFEKTIDKDAAYAVFSRLINGINHKTIVIISFDPEFVAANLIKTAKINKRTIYYVEV